MLPRISRCVIVLVGFVLWCFGQLAVPIMVVAPAAQAAADSGTAKLEVIESSSPTNDSGRFDLKIDGTKFATNVGDGGTTTSQVVTSLASHVVLEQANSSTNTTALGNYTTNIVCKDQHGSGAVLGSSSPTGSTSRQLTITTPIDSDVLCTVSNMRQTGTVTITNQVVNDNGGLAGPDDFGITLGPNLLAPRVSTTIPTGTYTLTETGVVGYDVTSIAGSSCPAQFGGTMTLTKGQAITCVVTHDDRPGQIRAIASVINDNGGTATTNDVQLTINGQSVLSGQYLLTNVGQHIIAQSNLEGYSTSRPQCADDTTQQTVEYPVAVSLAQSVTCAIAFDDIAPTLTVTASVRNDNGGDAKASDFILRADDTSLTSGIETTLQAGTFVVSEGPKAGYSRSAWVGDCDSNGSINLHLGGHYACGIANDDQAATLTIHQVVINNNGGTNAPSAFGFSVNNDPTQLFDTTATVTRSVDAGSYTVTGVKPLGYDTVYENCGNLVLKTGDHATCTITSDDVAPSLTIFNQANPASNRSFNFASIELGGFALIGDDTMRGSRVFADLNTGVYVVNESLLAGWVPPTISCDNGAAYTIDGSVLTLTLNLADHVTCYFVNTPESAASARNTKPHTSTAGFENHSASPSNSRSEISSCAADSPSACSDARANAPIQKDDKLYALGESTADVNHTGRSVPIWLPAGLVALALGTALVSWLLARPRIH